MATKMVLALVLLALSGGVYSMPGQDDGQGEETGGASGSQGPSTCLRSVTATNISWFMAAPLWQDIENLVQAWDSLLSEPETWTQELEDITSKAAGEAREKARLLEKWADLAGKLREKRQTHEVVSSGSSGRTAGKSPMGDGV